jgi:YidC/Oxa1 family membrane protein insertase
MIIITPLIKILEEMLNFFYGLTGDYGFSLIILSLAVTLIMLPLFWFAEKIQRQDRHTKNKIKPELQKLKAVDNTQKKYFYTKRVYKQFGYHPIYSLCSLFGLLIQIPFFIAAYQMLGAFAGFDGVSFGFIANLIQPDSLLRMGSISINILPFIMTGVNLLSGFLYSRGMDKAEKIQLFAIAGLFFFLLYNQPAALVLYWTMNNIFSIGKNWLFNKLMPAEKVCSAKQEVNVLFPDRQSLLHSVKFFLKHYWELLTYLTAFSCFYLAVGIIFSFNSLFTGSVPIIVCSGMIFIALTYSKSITDYYKIEIRNRRIIIYSLIFGFSCGAWGVVELQPAAVADIADIIKRNILLALGIIFLSFNIFANLLTRRVKAIYHLPNDRRDEKSGQLITLFILALFFIGMLLFFYLPGTIYLTSPSEFTLSIYKILLNNCPLFILYLAVGVAILLLNRFKHNAIFIITASSAGLIFFILINGIFCARKLGVMSFFVFDIPVNASIIRHGFEYIIAICCLTFAFVMIKKRPNVIMTFLLLINLVFAVKFTYDLSNRQAIPTANSDLIKSPQQGKYQDLLEFSRSGKNIVFLILDMFPGSFIEPLFNDYPDYKNDFTGFTWYPNTLSVTNLTYYTIPVFNGDMRFSPESLNKYQGTLQEKTTESYEKLFSALQQNRFTVSCVTHEYYQPALIPILNQFKIKGVANNYFIDDKSISSKTDMRKIYHKLLSNIATLLITPSMLNNYIYQDGLWQVVEEQKINCSLPSKSVLKALAVYSSITKTGNTYKRFHNSLSHAPYLLDTAGNIAVNNPSMSHDAIFKKNAYSTMKVTLDLLVQWLAWLKKNNLYDNTKIILVSDHSHEKHEIMMDIIKGKKFKVKKSIRNRLHALLMVKPFNSHQPFTVDWRLMSTADVTAMIATELDNPQALTVAPDPTQGAPIKRALPVFWLNDVSYSSDRQLIYDKYMVSDSIFESSNWEKIANDAW